MVSVLLAPAQIQALLEKLEDLGDQSFQIRSTILFQKQYLSEHCKVWVDVWPEFTTILMKKQLSKNLNDIYYIFTLDEEELKNMLENTDIVKWENALFQAYPYDYHKIIEEITKKRGFGLRCEENIYRLYKYNKNILKQRSVPEYVTVGTLSSEMVDWVLNCKPTPLLGDNSLPHVSYLISNYPSVCVFDASGTPIAFEIEYEYGAIGMLFVKPYYRRRGLGKLVTSIFLKKCADFSYSPFVIISDDNEVSIKLHIDLGFQKTDIFLFSSKGGIRKESVDIGFEEDYAVIYREAVPRQCVPKTVSLYEEVLFVTMSPNAKHTKEERIYFFIVVEKRVLTVNFLQRVEQRLKLSQASSMKIKTEKKETSNVCSVTGRDVALCAVEVTQGRILGNSTLNLV